jgi:TonB family protein
MNRLRLAVSLTGIAVLLAGTVRLAAGWFPLAGEPQVIQQQSAEPESAQPAQNSIRPGIPAFKVEMAANAQPAVAPAPNPAKPSSREPKEEAGTSAQVAPPQRDPIKVGGNVQESKLIHRVEPIYPEQALKARVSGTVILLITVNEAGFVSDVQVTSGHPMLNEAAITAVKQWQYSPTRLNGEPVPVIANVTVVFAIKGDKAETGIAPFPPAGKAQVSVIQSDGLGGMVVFRATPIDEKGSPSPDAEFFHAPELATSLEIFQQWHKIAEAGWPADVAKTTPLSYMFVVNEAGGIENFMRVQGPKIPELEGEVAQMGVVSSGLRGSISLRSLCVIQISLETPGLIQSPRL